MKYSFTVPMALLVLLSACGVRDPDPVPGAVVAASPATGTTTGNSPSPPTGSSTSSGSSSSSSSDELANDEQFEDNVVVKLQFSDPYTGFWENESWPDQQATQILRITYGVRRFHIERFKDESSGTDALLQNCFTRSTGQVQRDKSVRGLWFTYETTDSNGDPITSDDGWSLVGNGLEYTKFLGGEEIESAFTSYKRVYPGLAVDGLQLCTDGA